MSTRVNRNSSIVLNSNFSLWTFHLYVAIFQQHLHMNYISFLWYHIIQLVVPFKIYLIDCCSLQNKQVHQGFLLVRLTSSRFAVATMTWVTVTEYPCHKYVNDHGYVSFVVVTILPSFLFRDWSSDLTGK